MSSRWDSLRASQGTPSYRWIKYLVSRSNAWALWRFIIAVTRQLCTLVYKFQLASDPQPQLLRMYFHDNHQTFSSSANPITSTLKAGLRRTLGCKPHLQIGWIMSRVTQEMHVVWLIRPWRLHMNQPSLAFLHPQRLFFASIKLRLNNISVEFFYFITYQLVALCVAICGAPINDISLQLSAAGGNRTILKSETAPGWTSNANYRGTLDIVWSCGLTLTACIYTPPHLNVRAYTSHRWLRWRKVQWAAMSLLAPEIVLYTALVQFIEARNPIR